MRIQRVFAIAMVAVFAFAATLGVVGMLQAETASACNTGHICIY